LQEFWQGNDDTEKEPGDEDEKKRFEIKILDMTICALMFIESLFTVKIWKCQNTPYWKCPIETERELVE
jgi:hypothetical protein